jgi:hypothetical protein
VNDGFAMKILEAFNNSIHKRLDFRSCKGLSGFDDFIERFVLAKLEKNVHIVFVFKIVHKFDNIFVMQSFVEADFV